MSDEEQFASTNAEYTPSKSSSTAEGKGSGGTVAAWVSNLCLLTGELKRRRPAWFSCRDRLPRGSRKHGMPPHEGHPTAVRDSRRTGEAGKEQGTVPHARNLERQDTQRAGQRCRGEWGTGPCGLNASEAAHGGSWMKKSWKFLVLPGDISESSK